MTTRRKSIAKYSAVEKNLESAVMNLESAWIASEQAIAVRDKEAKKLTSVVKRLTKKRATLNKRKKTAATRVRTAPGADTRSALRTVVKDLSSTTKELAKAKAAKAGNATELTPLKLAYRRANAYAKAIAKADATLNKPKKKSRRR